MRGRPQEHEFITSMKRNITPEWVSRRAHCRAGDFSSHGQRRKRDLHPVALIVAGLEREPDAIDQAIARANSIARLRASSTLGFVS